MNYIAMILLSFACSNLNLLILGDSQASERSWGGALRDEFQSCGSSVDLYYLNGWNNSRIWEFIQGEEISDTFGRFPGHVSRYEIVILIGGDNDVGTGDYTEEVIEMINYFDNNSSTSVFYSILPPATIIGDLNHASSRFPRYEINDEHYWFTNGFYQRRNSYREKLISAINFTNANVIDIVEIADSAEITIPNFRDGIHIPYNVGKRFAKCIMPFSDC